MSANINETTSQSNLWSFIQNSKATEYASLKRLQSFVLSLSKSELKHMIELYLRSAMIGHRDRNGLTLGESHKKIKNNHNNNNNLIKNSLDTTILNKMQTHIGTKYGKKILVKLKQNQIDNQHLLSINPQVLSTSFQYLSYKELCRIQPTCTYFIYLHKSHIRISHHYINLNRTFWKNIFKSKINLNSLQHFKHIQISNAYKGWYGDKYRDLKRQKLFESVLKIIIKQSITSVQTLEICINNWSNNSLDRGDVYLSQILKSFDNLPKPLQLTNLKWSRDVGYGVQNTMKQIQNEIVNKFPKLTKFSYGFEKLRSFIGDDVHGLFCARVITEKFRNKLVEINLRCKKINLYQTEYKMIKYLSKCKKLKKLTIFSLIDDDEDSEDVAIGNIDKLNNKSLEELHLDFMFKDNKTDQVMCVQQILSNLFTVFVNIKSFNFRHTATWSKPFNKIGVDWKLIFKTLFQQKISFSMKNDENVNVLSELKFNGLHLDAISLIDGLMDCYDEKHCGLQRIEIQSDYQWKRPYDLTQSKINKLINNHLIPFLKLNKNQTNLKYLKIGCSEALLGMEALYMSWIMNLLKNIPKSLLEIRISTPYFSKAYGGNLETKHGETMELVKLLCEIKAKQDENCILESVILNGMTFHRKAIDYLRFIFGFNKQIYIDDSTYHLYFNQNNC